MYTHTQLIPQHMRLSIQITCWAQQLILKTLTENPKLTLTWKCTTSDTTLRVFAANTHNKFL